MVPGVKLRSVMSSIIRCRSGVMGCSLAEVSRAGSTLIMAQAEHARNIVAAANDRGRGSGERGGQEGLGTERALDPGGGRRVRTTAERFSPTNPRQTHRARREPNPSPG